VVVDDVPTTTAVGDAVLNVSAVEATVPE